ncbi:MAG: hypothetical protein ACLTDP_06760 [Terrisporobacter sp.]
MKDEWNYCPYCNCEIKGE